MSTSSSPLLRMHGIEKRFGNTQALADVSLELRAGEVLALLGENGAGKSTLMKVLSGAVRPDAGKIELAGAAYAPAGPHAARLAGVAMIYQELTLADDLSVEDNIMLGQEQHRWGWLDRTHQRKRIRQVLSQLGHADLPLGLPVARLSVAARQMVEIARALVLRSRVIVFDEPTSSLTQHDARRLFDVVRQLREAGLGVIYISHFLEEVRAVADRYTVLRDGRSVGSGTLAGATEAKLVRLMVGRDVDDLFPSTPRAAGDVLLEVDQLWGRPSPRNISLEVRRGEILGIAGLIGAGRTELLRCLYGLAPVRSGRVRLAGNVLKGSPGRRIAAGLGLVSEDRKSEGLAQNQSIADNLTASRLGLYHRWGFLNLEHRRAAVVDWMRRLHIKAAGPDQPIGQLSGGNQQKVAIARVLHQQADVLLLDEPTRGVDVATKAEIYRLMSEQAAAGKAVIFVSSYLPELLAVSDRLAVMSRGQLRSVRPAGQWTEESVLAAAIGTASAAPTD